ncbi:tRNA-dihydrouridine(16/17) synthase [NAD(P)(+)]-like isoform X2 [Schistocerca gregaria]|uniref:tRNA-dihydrouridine(16/17) synthase [NAD(P)(+)]-like isoform X2 n=1 Tax=Schistocerca gregaria TaxID=7010 RepID=UPI00211ED963|nr:tRNA-dihydrouridine(16/17) synthase [NAD(P)(+)]-like isoform X2 [Schistocerca gregaria]
MVSYRYEFDPADRPLILQVLGNKPEPVISLATSPFLEGHIDGVDLNCGCPQQFAMDKRVGAGILRDPELLIDLARQCACSIPYPLSVKMRLHEEGPQTTARIAEKLHTHSGVKAVTVHGRYWWQKGVNRGQCDWKAIETVRKLTPASLFVIGNGDVASYADFERYRVESGVDSVMAGYGALLDPTIFQENSINLDQVISDYFEIAVRHKNSFMHILRHVHWMIKSRPYQDSSAVHARLFSYKTLEQIQTLLRDELDIHVRLPCVPQGESRIIYPKGASDIVDPKKLKLYLAKEAKLERKKKKKKLHSNRLPNCEQPEPLDWLDEWMTPIEKPND